MALLDHTISRFFSHNRVIMDLACATQLQLLATLAVGAVNYLLAALPVLRATADKVDRPTCWTPPRPTTRRSTRQRSAVTCPWLSGC